MGESSGSMRGNAAVEKERQAAFASIMARRTTDWADFGLNTREKQHWERQGIPADKAHWAAIIRDLSEAMQFKVGSHSRLAGSQGEPHTVLEALEQGKPGARICHLLAKHRAVPDPTAAPVRSVINPKTVRVGPHPWDRAEPLPYGMGRLLDAVSARARDELVALAPFEQITAESVSYLDSQRNSIGSLLSAAAASYGVYGSGDELDVLAACWADPGSQIANNGLSAKVFCDIGRDRHLYFLTPPCANEIAHGAAVAVPPENELPSPTGFAWLARDPDDERPAEVLAWSCAGGEVTVVWSTAAALFARLSRENVTQFKGAVARYRYRDRTAESLSGIEEGTAAVALLARFSALYKSREILASPGDGVTDRSSRGSRSVGREPVVIRYRSVHGGISATRRVTASYALTDIRWRVRGHWRNQWYPSEQVRRPIWIEEHEAGHSLRGAVVMHDIVTKL